jgi:hypothetical protein
MNINITIRTSEDLPSFIHSTKAEPSNMESCTPNVNRYVNNNAGNMEISTSQFSDHIKHPLASSVSKSHSKSGHSLAVLTRSDSNSSYHTHPNIISFGTADDEIEEAVAVHQQPSSSSLSNTAQPRSLSNSTSSLNHAVPLSSPTYKGGNRSNRSTPKYRSNSAGMSQYSAFDSYRDVNTSASVFPPSPPLAVPDLSTLSGNPHSQMKPYSSTSSPRGFKNNCHGQNNQNYSSQYKSSHPSSGNRSTPSHGLHSPKSPKQIRPPVDQFPDIAGGSGGLLPSQKAPRGNRKRGNTSNSIGSNNSSVVSDSRRPSLGAFSSSSEADEGNKQHQQMNQQNPNPQHYVHPPSHHLSSEILLSSPQLHHNKHHSNGIPSVLVNPPLVDSSSSPHPVTNLPPLQFGSLPPTPLVPPGYGPLQQNANNVAVTNQHSNAVPSSLIQPSLAGSTTPNHNTSKRSRN